MAARPPGVLISTGSRKRALVALVTLTSLLGQPRAWGTTSSPVPVTVWTINVHQMLLNEAGLFARMRDENKLPDLIAVQEISKKRQTVFMSRLRAAIPGPRWVARHGEDRRYLGPEADMQDNTMIVWDADRFAIRNRRIRGSNVLRWAQWIDCQAKPERGNSVIAVRLWDQLSNRAIVATSVRWRYTTARPCMIKNVTAFDAAIERRWPQRPMTIFAGDFNAHPQQHECSADDCPSGRQEEPDCWYRLLTPERLDDCPADAGRSEPAYFDTVFVEARAGGDFETSICRQWSHANEGDQGGDACAPHFDEEDDRWERDKSRLDYIWVRWEDDSGARALFTNEGAAQLVGTATADPVCIDAEACEQRYSDHRAVYATLGWPGQTSPTQRDVATLVDGILSFFLRPVALFDSFAEKESPG